MQKIAWLLKRSSSLDGTLLSIKGVNDCVYNFVLRIHSFNNSSQKIVEEVVSKVDTNIIIKKKNSYKVNWMAKLYWISFQREKKYNIEHKKEKKMQRIARQWDQTL